MNPQSFIYDEDITFKLKDNPITDLFFGMARVTDTIEEYLSDVEFLYYTRTIQKRLDKSIDEETFKIWATIIWLNKDRLVN